MLKRHHIDAQILLKGATNVFSWTWRSLKATFGRRFWTEALKDVLFAASVVIVLIGLIYAYTGTWPPFVTVEGQSMLPNMRQNDLIIIKGLDSAGVNTYSQSLPSGHKMFSDYGDVIVYRPFGDATGLRSSTAPCIT